LTRCRSGCARRRCGKSSAASIAWRCLSHRRRRRCCRIRHRPRCRRRRRCRRRAQRPSRGCRSGLGARPHRRMTTRSRRTLTLLPSHRHRSRLPRAAPAAPILRRGCGGRGVPRPAHHRRRCRRRSSRCRRRLRLCPPRRGCAHTASATVIVSRGDVVRCRNVSFIHVNFCTASRARRTCICFAALLESTSIKPAARIACGIFRKEAPSWMFAACSTFLLNLKSLSFVDMLRIDYLGGARRFNK